jgi:polysaccharide pyruvyl transferase WcaK-like protein
MASDEAYQILNGLGAGNIGDNLMAHAFWDSLPPAFRLHVAVFGNYKLQRQSFPSQHKYYEYNGEDLECSWVRGMPAVLVGTSCITDAEGHHWPLGFLAERLRVLHENGVPVDAIGVGVDGVWSPEGRRLFEQHFLQIRSWTVRDAAARDFLIGLGVHADKVAVGADWGWLYPYRQPPPGWAKGIWRDCGIDTTRPLIVLNLFHQGGSLDGLVWRELASGLDRLAKEDGFQVAHFCNEMRHPGFDLEAAQSLAARMAAPLALVPNEYYSPSEAIDLLRHATVTVGRRYHFCLESVMAGVSHVNLGRGQKLLGLSQELELTPAGDLAQLSGAEFCAAVRSAAEHRTARVARQTSHMLRLQQRARENLRFFRTYAGLEAADFSINPLNPAGS